MTRSELPAGRRESRRDYSDSGRFARLAALLDYDASPWRPGIMPPLGHWLCFLPDERQSLIARDGHPNRTDDSLLPDSALPRRMWAGSTIHFLHDMPLDVPVVRQSTVVAITPKVGRSGQMLFVTVRHEIGIEGGAIAIVEEQDIVYREAPPPSSVFTRSAGDPGSDDPVTRIVATDPVKLFRYSALTFNAHRIHYDGAYAREEEGYPGLVVHGPLLATLMLDHAMRHAVGRRIRSFQFRVLSPIFVGESICLGLRPEGRSAVLRAIGPAGVAVTGEVSW